jgi:uncharacterized damage-inducible protein DinB
VAGTRKPRQLGTREAARQFIEGTDFEPPARAVSNISPELATTIPPGCPYSVATQVAHMLFWQKRWLGSIDNLPLEVKKGKHGDFPKVAPADWEAIRDEFLAGLKTVKAKAADNDELSRALPKGKLVEQLVLQIVIHNTYHLGQISLLRQLLNSWPPAGGWDSW